MVGHPVFNPHADGADFSFLEPDAGHPLAAVGIEPEVGEGADDGILEDAEEGVKVFAVTFEGEDEVADELSGPVEGDIAAAAGLVELDAAFAQGFGVPDQVLCGGLADPESENRGVLGKYEGIGDAVFPAEGDVIELPLKGFGIFDAPPVLKGKRRGLSK